jgi:hypothetical protein
LGNSVRLVFAATAVAPGWALHTASLRLASGNKACIAARTTVGAGADKLRHIGTVEATVDEQRQNRRRDSA